MCSHVIHVVLFFFFKQKTAYEMRISDWSSDVCSSDLLDAMRASALEICSNEKGFLKSTAMQDTIALVDDDRNILTSVSIALEAEGFKEIGRASCRERVCKYV